MGTAWYCNSNRNQHQKKRSGRIGQSMLQAVAALPGSPFALKSHLPRHHPCWVGKDLQHNPAAEKMQRAVPEVMESIKYEEQNGVLKSTWWQHCPTWIRHFTTEKQLGKCVWPGSQEQASIVWGHQDNQMIFYGQNMSKINDTHIACHDGHCSALPCTIVTFRPGGIDQKISKNKVQS